MAGATTGNRLTSPKPTSNGKHPGGRPKIVFDLDLVERLGGLNATLGEMGTLLNCSHDVIQRQMKIDGGEFRVAYEKGKETHRVPAFTRSVVDTMGAGDAFLAVSSPLVAAGVPISSSAFIGNMAGALKVRSVGHRKSIDKVDLSKAVTALLK